MKAPTCLVVGAGSVGINAAIFLKLHGFEVELLESEPDVLRGAAQVSFVNHGDGFEYFTPGHVATGEFCIEGALFKALMYPLDFLSTKVCTAERPLRFMVAQAAVETGAISVQGFERNARHMMAHYRKVYDEMGAAAGLSAEERERVFVRHPDKFMRLMTSGDYRDVQGIAAGAYGNGFGINMPHYFAAVKAVLRRLAIEPRVNSRIRSIQRITEGYEVKVEGGSYRADHVLICSAHHIPALASRIHGAKVIRQFAGTYYLNSMTFVRLPATSDPEILAAANRINFTLMGEHGGMFACIAPPTPTADGTAAIYLPAEGGSHVARQVSPPGFLKGPPEEWDEIVAHGLSNTDLRVETTLEKVSELYGFLKGYAQVSNTACRTVFNVASPDSDCGQKRSVREQSFESHALTDDGLVTAYAAPKWTNAEFTAAIALSDVCKRRGRGHWVISGKNRYIDAGRLLREHHFRGIKTLVADTENYCQSSPAPGCEQMVDRSASPFHTII